jgi:hypothetical protein
MARAQGVQGSNVPWQGPYIPSARLERQAAIGSGRRVSSRETGGTVAGGGREEAVAAGGGGGRSLHETASEKRKVAAQLLL